MMSEPPPLISVEEIENLSEPQLRARVNQWFEHLRSCPGDLRAGVVAKAEFYMRELERRESAKIAARDYTMAVEDREKNAAIAARDLRLAEQSHKMEVWVIVLIGAELVLAILGIIYGYIESDKQKKVLDAMNTSTGNTANAMKDVSGYLRALSEDQKNANSSIQDNLKLTKGMATALQQQLDILKQQQADRLAELSKKPKLELFVGSANINLNTTPPVPIPIREETDTSQSFDLHLRNSGTASALNGVLRVVIFAPDVMLQGTPLIQLITDESNTQQHVYLLNFERLRPGINIPVTIVFTFSKAHAPFSVLFNVDDDESDSATFLGSLNIVPKK